MSNTKRSSRFSKRETVHATPIPVIENLFNHHKIKEGNILELSAGNGNFVKVIKDNFNNHITALEIRKEEYENLSKYADEVIIDDFLNKHIESICYNNNWQFISHL